MRSIMSLGAVFAAALLMAVPVHSQPWSPPRLPGPELSITPPTAAQRDGQQGVSGRVYMPGTPAPLGIDCGGPRNDCRKAFPPGAHVTLRTLPGQGIFVAWSDACSGNGASCTVNLPLTGNRNVVAFFARPELRADLTALVASPLGLNIAGPNHPHPTSLDVLSSTGGQLGPCHADAGASCRMLLDASTALTLRQSAPSGERYEPVVLAMTGPCGTQTSATADACAVLMTANQRVSVTVGLPRIKVSWVAVPALAPAVAPSTPIGNPIDVVGAATYPVGPMSAGLSYAVDTEGRTSVVRITARDDTQGSPTSFGFWRFIGFTGAGCGSGTVCQFTTAALGKDSLTVSYAPLGNVVVTVPASGVTVALAEPIPRVNCSGPTTPGTIAVKCRLIETGGTVLTFNATRPAIPGQRVVTPSFGTTCPGSQTTINGGLTRTCTFTLPAVPGTVISLSAG